MSSKITHTEWIGSTLMALRCENVFYIKRSVTESKKFVENFVLDDFITKNWSDLVVGIRSGHALKTSGSVGLNEKLDEFELNSISKISFFNVTPGTFPNIKSEAELKKILSISHSTATLDKELRTASLHNPTLIKSEYLPYNESGELKYVRLTFSEVRERTETSHGKAETKPYYHKTSITIGLDSGNLTIFFGPLRKRDTRPLDELHALYLHKIAEIFSINPNDLEESITPFSFDKQLKRILNKTLQNSPHYDDGFKMINVLEENRKLLNDILYGVNKSNALSDADQVRLKNTMDSIDDVVGKLGSIFIETEETEGEGPSNNVKLIRVSLIEETEDPTTLLGSAPSRKIHDSNYNVYDILQVKDKLDKGFLVNSLTIAYNRDDGTSIMVRIHKDGFVENIGVGNYLLEKDDFFSLLLEQQ